MKINITHIVQGDDFGDHSDSADCLCKPEVTYSGGNITVTHDPYYKEVEQEEVKNINLVQASYKEVEEFNKSNGSK